MAEEPTSTLTKKHVSAANRWLGKPTKATSTASMRHRRLMSRVGHILTGTAAIAAALLSASGVGLVQLMENQAFSAFFQLRGPILPPEDIVILAIDDQSISNSKQYYNDDPQRYAHLEPLKSFPFKRIAYAQIIEKLIQAGARTVALDVLFDTPSSYGPRDDRQLQAALQQYGSKVTLAALYENSVTAQGSTIQLRLPQQIFRTGSVSIGTVNFPLDVDGKIHRLAGEYTKASIPDEIAADKVPSFDEAVLRAARVDYPRTQGDRIHFWGPPDTFEQIPFWYVLDPQSWNDYLQQGKVFKNKIVLVGATAQLPNDYHAVAVSKNTKKMSGVEVHANAIATLISGKAIAQAIVSPPLRGLFVLVLVGGSAVLITRTKRGITRLILSIAIASIWGGTSYVLFIYGQLIFPTTVPMIAIAFIGLTYLGTEGAKEVLRKRQLLDIFQKYKTSPVVQEIISQQDDLQDLLQQRDLAVAGKMLSGRYKIIKVLSAGGFSETYIAEDTQRPGNPQCVVKQLKPANTKTEALQLARRLFNSEAQTLEKLGTHNQIPQLLAFFEQDTEFYLIQEFIIGHPLNQELPLGKRILEKSVIDILKDLLQTLAFIHQNGVIHRDIKPSNIIRRHSDWKLVLIDFGAVKEATMPQQDSQGQTPFTIGIGTKGYAPSEQCFGRPQYSSDIYAIGMIGIKALTGIAPHEFKTDADQELQWRDKAEVTHSLAEILTQMVRNDYRQRYQSASEVLQALDKLVSSPDKIDSSSINTFSLDDDIDASTTPWIEEP
ncbi:serine/threonine-protein kinase [Fortiea contorta]|uniref:serine/threonine-protein kinase n=1 Tax=Fortiea contorta TaxID=1892405 RepID=UPI0003457B5E|nr:serine/threonine-protein kinase [Fortiea contorta]